MLRPPAEVVEKLVYPKFEPSALDCANDPDLPATITQDVDIPIQELWDAWADCKAKLGKVRDLVATWPKEK